MKSISNLNGQPYSPENCWYILNHVQAERFAENNYFPIDIIVGRERRLCYVYIKNELGKTLQTKWREYKLD